MTTTPDPVGERSDSPGAEMTERYEKARAALHAWDYDQTIVYVQTLTAILDLHKPVTVYTPTPHCRVCGSLPWPCSSASLVLDATP